MPFLAEVDAAVWGLVGAAITAAGAVVVRIIFARHQITKEERQDLREEWRELADRQALQIEKLQARIVRLEEDNAACQKENRSLTTRVAVLETQQGLTPNKGVSQ